MTIVLTGATGFIGGHFAHHASAAGHPLRALLRAGAVATTPDALTHDGSVSQLADALTRSNATTIVHCAAAFSPADDPAQTDALLAANLDLPILLLQAARQAGVRKWLNIGSLWEHNASGARDPVNLYAAMKTAFEDILAYTAQTYGMAAITLKLSDTYGPNDTRPKLIPHLKSLLDTGETLQMTAGQQTVCYCHIDDICHAMLQGCAALDTTTAGHRMYVVEGDEPMVLRDMITRILTHLEGRLSVVFDSVPIDGHKPGMPWIGGPRLSGWTPKIPLIQGMLATLTAP